MRSAHSLITPPKVQQGDRVAILSPSWAGPGAFPDVHELGIAVLREVFQLEPVEYPSTRRLGASPQARAEDLMDAFADPSIKAVMASIGGSDQITVLPHLTRDVFVQHPKAFFGYSDNTNLLNWLWSQGVAGYHGGSTLVHLARPGGAHPVFLDSLRHALFDHGAFEIEPLAEFTDLQCRWEDLTTLREPLTTSPDAGWTWHNASKVVSALTWGGNLEILHWNLAVDRWMLPVERYSGCILLLETSEEMPDADEVFTMLRNFGERGLLAQFPAVVMAKAKAWHTSKPLEPDERTRFRAQQRDALLRAMEMYNPDAMVVVGPDFGHTDPQYVLPYGGQMTIDGPAQRIFVQY